MSGPALGERILELLDAAALRCGAANACLLLRRSGQTRVAAASRRALSTSVQLSTVGDWDRVLDAGPRIPDVRRMPGEPFESLASIGVAAVAVEQVPVTAYEVEAAALCLLDTHPNCWPDETISGLQRFARHLAFELELALDPALANLTRPVPADGAEPSDQRRDESLRQGESLARSIIDSLPGIFYMYDHAGRFLRWNRELEAVTGYTSEALAELHPLDLFEGEDRRRAHDAIETTLTEGAIDVEVALTARDGRRIPYLFTGRRQLLGGAPCVLGMGVDLSARVAAEQAVRDSETRFRTLVDSAPEVIFTIDERGRFVSLNPAFETLHGWPRGAWIGETFDKIVHPDDLPLAEETFRRIMRGERTPPLELRTRRRDASRPVTVEMRLTALDQAAGGRLLLGMSHDISERKRLEEQIRQTQKLESVGRLAAGIAHDFNNLLTVIGGHASLLRTLGACPETVAEYGAEIESAVERASALVQQLLIFSRDKPVRRESLDLGPLLDDTARMLARVLGEDIRLEIDCRHACARVHADAGMIGQLVMNLAINARDAMPAGGTLTLATDRVTVGTARAAGHPDATPGDYVRLRVADTGSGIPAAQLERIFEPFYTTKEHGVGTGLGLATVYGIATQHGGWVEVDSTPGCGTVFTTFVPAA